MLEQVLPKFDEFAEKPNELGRVVLVELLAYQFASPVRWIETQELFFKTLDIQVSFVVVAFCLALALAFIVLSFELLLISCLAIGCSVWLKLAQLQL